MLISEFMLIKSSKIALVSHDAGGAEILSSYVRRQNLDCHYVLDGPARKIFENKLGQLEILPLDQAIRQSTAVLCGTSWQSDLEVKAIKISKEQGKKSTTFLDHWVNYRERFILQGHEYLPDEIWVGDKDAQSIAEVTFSGTPIRLFPNPYCQDLLEIFSQIQLDARLNPFSRVLYVCEPIREHASLQYGDERYFGYTEEEALIFFLEHIHVVDDSIDQIVLRPHPSEHRDKYDWVLQTFPFVKLGGEKPLFEEIIASDVVAGCESMAMVVGLLANKRVISTIPFGGRACSLPHSKIEHIQQLLVKFF